MSLTKQDLTDIKTVVVDAINESFELLTVPRFDALEVRMDRMENQMDGLEGRMDSLEGRMSGIEGQMVMLDSNQQTTNRLLSALESRLENIEGEIETLKNDVMALYKLVGKKSGLEKDFDKLSSEEKVRAMYSQLLTLARQLNINLN